MCRSTGLAEEVPSATLWAAGGRERDGPTFMPRSSRSTTRLPLGALRLASQPSASIEEQHSQDRLAGITPPHSSGVLQFDGSYTQKLWMRVKRKAAYLPG